MIKKISIKNIFLLVAFMAIFNKVECQDYKPYDYSALYKDLPFKMEVVQHPVIPAVSVNITDFGAKGDGITSNTKAIASAIEAVVKKGGGTVIIPEGVWITGPIVFKSNIRLHTKKGALILFSKDKSEYPLVKTWYEGLQSWRAMAPLFAENVENIALTGEGIFDGSGEVWRPAKRFLHTEGEWKKIVSTPGGIAAADGKSWYPDSSSYKGQLLGSPRGELDLQQAMTIKTFLRPVMLNFLSCKKVLIDGPTFQNSPSWCLHPVLCENIIISNVKVLNEDYIPNGDALDLESCRNSIIYNCLFDAGDDGICMKSGRDKEGRDRGVPTENVIISKCIVYSGHGGFVIGSEMSGGARNIKVSHCSFMGTDNGLRFKSTRGRGGLVENIYINDVYMSDIVQDAILFDLYYFVKERSANTPPVDEKTPQFRNIHIKNVVCKGAKRAILLQGLPEMNLSNISFENVVIEAATGMYCNDATNIKMKDLCISTPAMPVIKIENAKDITLEGLSLLPISNNAIEIDGNKTAGIIIQGKDISSAVVSVSASVNKNNVKVSQ